MIITTKTLTQLMPTLLNHHCLLNFQTVLALSAPDHKYPLQCKTIPLWNKTWPGICWIYSKIKVIHFKRICKGEYQINTLSQKLTLHVQEIIHCTSTTAQSLIQPHNTPERYVIVSEGFVIVSEGFAQGHTESQCKIQEKSHVLSLNSLANFGTRNSWQWYLLLNLSDPWPIAEGL